MVDLVAYFFSWVLYANGTNFFFEMKLVRHYFGSTPKRYASFDIFFEFLAVKSSRNNLPSYIYALSIQRS